jgi:uncharacterized membrane protein YeiB
MLLFIALANVSIHIYDQDMSYGHRPVGGEWWDHLVDFWMSLLVAQHSYPMFAMLAGYGIAAMSRRMDSRGFSMRAKRHVLARRGAWLVAFGMVHAFLLFDGDVLTVYGITTLIVLFLVDRRRTVLLRWFTASLLVLSAISVGGALQNDFESEAQHPEGYLTEALHRLGSHAVLGVMVAVGIPFVCLAVAGFFISRVGFLDRPREHRGTLRRIVLVAGSTSLITSLPFALIVAHWWQPSDTLIIAASSLNDVAGLAMGFVYICLFALLAARLETGVRSRPLPTADDAAAAPEHISDANGTAGQQAESRWVSAVVGGVQALGRRSLTCYLMQSAVFFPILSPWGLGLGRQLGSAALSLVAVAVWGSTLLAAIGLERANRRGPFEVLLRRLTYGRPESRPVPAPVPTQ